MIISRNSSHTTTEVKPSLFTFRIAHTLLLLTLLSVSALSFAQTLGSVEEINIHGRSLEGNLNGDSPDRSVIVYLPPSYAENPDRHYPVVYFLHGYGLQAQLWMTIFNIEAAANTAMTGSGGGVGTGELAQEMILVNPSAYSIYDGSMYSNSVVAGDWESFIADEVVAYIDSHYRTLPDRMSRGLSGHSMGGYGAFRIAMKRPDVFSSVYPLAACCTLEYGDLGETMSLAGDYQTREEVVALNYPDKSVFARAAAWSPNPQNPPFYVDLPYVDGVLQPAIQAKWLANSLLAMMDQYTLNLRQYTAIKFDVGLEDSLLPVNQAIADFLTQVGVDYVFETYEGDHNNRVSERIETSVLPFFSDNLVFE